MLKKHRSSPGFILAESMVSLWIVVLLVLTYCAIDFRANKQEQRLAQRAQLSSQLLSKSREILEQTGEKPVKIEVDNGTQKITVEIKD